MTVPPAAELSPLDRARKKAYWRLLPILFLAYVIAFVDRANVAFAKLTMVKDLPGFDNSVIGLGAGIFFIGYFLLEIPGSVIVERWSARLWIFRIMVTWGLIAVRYFGTAPGPPAFAIVIPARISLPWLWERPKSPLGRDLRSRATLSAGSPLSRFLPILSRVTPSTPS